MSIKVNLDVKFKKKDKLLLSLIEYYVSEDKDRDNDIDKLLIDFENNREITVGD